MATTTKKKTTRKSGEGVIPKAGVASTFPFDYGRPMPVDNEMRRKAGYPPILKKTTKKTVKKSK